MLSLRMALKMARQELFFNRRKLRSVIFLLVLGFIGPLFVSALSGSVDEYLAVRSRSILSADVAVSAMRPIEDVELEKLRAELKPKKLVQETEFVTMARGRDVATLVEIKGEEAEFPLVGGFRLKGEQGEKKALPLTEDTIAWVFPEVLAQLGLKVGDPIIIGRAEFKITAIVEESPGSVRMGGVAPRVFIGRKFIADTKLTDFGSQVFHRVYFELPDGVTSDEGAARAKEALDNPDFFTRTPDDSIQGFERFFRFFSLYLNSVAMIVFVLSWVSAFYILQIYLQERLRGAAVILVNGGSRVFVALVASTQLILLMLLSFLAASAFVWVLIHLTPTFFADKLPRDFVLRLGFGEWSTLLIVALASALAFASPYFMRLASTPLQALLGENTMGIDRMTRLKAWASYSPLVVVFLALSVWLMESWISALRLAGGMALAALIGLVAGRALFRLLFSLVKHRPGLIRLMATSLARSRFGVNLCFLALVLASLALNLVPHLLGSVVSEIKPLKGRELPALFLFNIPESQVDALKSFAEQNKAELRYLSPLVLARLMKVNGDDPKEDRFQRFPVRVSYRDRMIASERIVAGRDFSGPYDPSRQQEAEISMELRFAERSGFKLGDKVEFDVQGIPIEGRVTSLRRVRWTDFHPNFFMMFQPGVLEDAPKSFLANVNVDGEEEKVRIQYELIKNFPDISVIDIGRTVARGLEIAQSVIGPVQVTAAIAVVMSFLVLLGVIAHNLRLRDAEVDIEKLMGADASLIRRILVGEYALTAIFAWLVGMGSALVLAWAVTVQVLEISLWISWWAVVISGIAIIAAASVITAISSTRVLNLRGASRKL